MQKMSASVVIDQVMCHNSIRLHLGDPTKVTFYCFESIGTDAQKSVYLT